MKRVFVLCVMRMRRNESPWLVSCHVAKMHLFCSTKFGDAELYVSS